LDDKILLGWNTLMITAYCKAAAATANTTYLATAINTMDFFEINLNANNGAWYHTYKNNQAKIPAFLDDYAYTIQAYIHLQETTGNTSYLEKAAKIMDYVLEHFVDIDGLFYYTNNAQTDVVVRKKKCTTEQRLVEML
jgi:uncharacterized protein YyaL (SSP411 family)